MASFLKSLVLFCSLCLIGLATSQAQQQALNDSVPFQGHPLLLTPITSDTVATKIIQECDHQALVTMIRELETRIAVALESSPEYDVYVTSEVVNDRTYQRYNCYVLRDSILSLQVQLDAALAGEPAVETRSVIEIAQQTAVLRGAVTDDGNVPLLAWGFKYGSDANLEDSVLVPFGDWAAFFATSELDTGSFQYTLPDLTRYTEYFYTALASNEEGVAYGDTLSFYTLPDLASQLTLDTSDVSVQAATLLAEVGDNGGQGPDSLWFYWGEADFSGPNLATDSLKAAAPVEGEYRMDLTGLVRYTDYYFNVAAHNLAGSASAAANFVFTTLPEAPTLGAAAWDAAANAVTGSITDLGGDNGAPIPDSTYAVWSANASLAPALGWALGTYTASDSTIEFSASTLPGGKHLHVALFAANAGGTSSSDTVALTTLVGVETVAATGITQTEATLESCFSFDNAVDSIGFIWSTEPNLAGALDSVRVDADAATSAVAGCDRFAIQLTNLVEYTTYYYTAFGSNSSGTAYGDTLSFTVLPALTCEPLTVDLDGYTYPVIQIGEQCWFAENLRTTTYSDGTSIPSGLNATEWAAAVNTEVGASAVVGQGTATEQENLDRYGRLYNWYAVETGKLCPGNWRVPSKDEFDAMISELGSGAATALAATSQDPSPWIGTNTSGWAGVPGGLRNRSNGEFQVVGEDGFWWSSTPAATVHPKSARILLLSGTTTLSSNTSLPYLTPAGMSVRCMRDPSPPAILPSASTSAASDVTSETATLNGSVDSDGYGTVSATGFVWGTDAVLSDGQDLAGNSTEGPFSASLTGLSAQTTYYFSAYVTNEVGTVYGDTLSFESTAFLCEIESVTLDGYDYSTVEVGNQCWFAENLKSTKYADGTTIPLVTSNTSWSNNTTGARCNVNNSASNTANYGYLYNWFAVDHAAGLCPAGWHVPTLSDIEALQTATGGMFVGGEALKASSNDTPSWDGTNSLDFKAVPSGYRWWGSGNYAGFGTHSKFWSSTPDDDLTAHNTFLYSELSSFTTSPIGKGFGQSVRCMRDLPPPSILPSASTSAASFVTSETATLNGSVDSDGYPAVSVSGFRWGEAADLNDAQDLAGSGTSGAFTGSLTGLTAGTTYYFVAYATNTEGTGFGDTLSFETATAIAGFANCGDNMSYQGYDYATVEIGTQCWFAENLRNEDYNDGNPIPSGLNDWSTTTNGAVTVYDEGGADEASNLANYGRLYNWHAVNTGTLCPIGWHVPTDTEWTTLTDYLGGASVAGAALKSSDSNGPSWAGTNISGFTGLPGGSLNGLGAFHSVGSFGFWWTSSPYNNYAWNRILSNSSSVLRVNVDPLNGFSVRCVQD